MGKFSGILLVSDIDGTLLRRDNSLGARNLEAVRRFQELGGRFTLATGRMPVSMGQILGGIHLNAPAICYNGACIFDHERAQVLWEVTLDEAALDVVAHVEQTLPCSGTEIYQSGRIHFGRVNTFVVDHIHYERIEAHCTPFRPTDLREIPRPWTKAIFCQDSAQTAHVKAHLLASPYAERYQFVQSGPYYLELLPPGTSKGRALQELARLLGQDLRRTIAVGDNENDADMLRLAGLGIAVENATASAKDHADLVTVHHEEDALHHIIDGLERGSINL